MKAHPVSAVVLATVLASSLMIAGCQTIPRHERATHVAEAADSLSRLLHKGIRQNDVLQASVRHLSKSGQEELATAYYVFENNASRLRDIAEEVKDVSGEMNEKTEEYFEKWEDDLKGIRNSRLKDLGSDRRAEVMDQCRAIADSMTKVEKAYKVYERDLADVEKFLGNDLTPAGLKLAIPNLKKVSRNSPAIKKATREVLDGVAELNRLLNQ